MASSPVHAADILQAQARISKVIAQTPLQYCPRLSHLTGAEVYLKREDLQDVRSYKIRGAYNAVSQLTPEQRGAGVVAASAGNHAQGVAYACHSLGIKGSIFVPETTPKQKRDRIRVHGGDMVDLVVTGANFDEAAAGAHEFAERTGATVIEPFDARDTVIGQGTVSAEIVSQLSALGKTLDRIYVPVGGAGLLAGTLSYVAELSPESEVVGVEPQGAASLAAALDNDGPTTLDTVDPFVDGASVARIGTINWEVVNAHRDILTAQQVAEGAVSTVMLDLYQNEGIIAEPAGALSVAGLVESCDLENKTVVCIISGGNNDVLRYGEIMERSLVHRGLKHYFLVNFPQEPGQLRNFVAEILGPNDDITLFEYLKRNNRETGTALVGLELINAQDLEPLLERMKASPISFERLEPGTAAYKYLT